MTITKPFDFFIQWHLTEKCNLSCRHCYQGEGDARELSLPEIAATIREAADMIRDWSDAYGIAFNPGMNITGGEPLLREDLFPILGMLKEQGFEISLLTNGTLIDRVCAEQLARHRVDSVQVSIEGPEDVHDSIRGQGSFTASRQGIQHLVDCGLDVTLNVTVSHLNADSLRKVVDFGTDAGVGRVGFSRLVPSGKGSALIRHMLSRAEIKQLYGSVLEPGLMGMEIITGDPVAAQMKKTGNEDAGDVAISGCAAALSGITIQANGDILPCRRLPLPLGNVKGDSLREVWASSPVLGALRDRSKYRGTCGRCPWWAECRGCRAIAFAWSRFHGRDDFLADDPQCFLHDESGCEQGDSCIKPN